ncbi:hypothetical protein VTK73DRAFT_4054 [Phialemonium thermophilum]|uniref:Uncharacterized protein n=1 Tax=Phialemonium thermophilum TaxID=223376 RepID=A0ABR3VCE4_9PEZI
MISQYNSADPRGPKNFSTVITQRIRMEGFIVLDYEKEYPEAWKNLGRWMAEGKLKRTETIVRGGLQAAEHALVDIFSGKNTGKMLVEVKKLEPVAKV